MTRRGHVGSALVASAFGAAVACGGSPASPGPVEAIQVSGGQYFPGPLPGSPPADAGVDSGADAGTLGPLEVTILNAGALPIPSGASNEPVSGEVTEDAYSVALRLADEGTGYWVVPVGAPDPLFPGQSGFSCRVNFSPAIPPGRHPFEAVAIGANGQPGTQVIGTICIQSAVPDNGHACNPSIAPPFSVISLTWDRPFNVNLHVVTPSGEDINVASPLGAVLDGGGMPPSNAPYLNVNSAGNCAASGLLEQDVVFPVTPASGIYTIYVDPFGSCGQPAVHFTVTVYTRTGACPDCSLQSIYTQSGELLASQTTGGASTGLFVHQVSF